MDLPKELLNKQLPKSKSVQTTPTGHKPAPASSAATCCAEEDDDFFLQAMQGIVKTPHSSKAAMQHGAFPLQEEHTFKKMAQPDRSTATKAQIVPAMQQTSTKTDSAPPPKVADASESDFALAMRTVKPLKGKGRDVTPEVETVDANAAQGKALQELLDGEIIFDVQVSGENIQGHVVGLDEKSFFALASGEHSPEARLDLHGLNAQQAFQALVPFFRMAWHKGLRTVIIVTGRGINSPTGIGILRHKVYTWLTQEPFKRVVMAFCTARPCDGGSGSMYVLLRKYRKKHRVYWERCPADSDLFS